MEGLEQKLFRKNKFNAFLWLLFLDDIFCIWRDGEEKLNKFLNICISSTHIAMKKSFSKINFPDVTFSKNNNKVST